MAPAAAMPYVFIAILVTLVIKKIRLFVPYYTIIIVASTKEEKLLLANFLEVDRGVLVRAKGEPVHFFINIAMKLQYSLKYGSRQWF